MLETGETIELTIDRPAAGGRMIARHEGQIVLVAGAIPGERVRVRIERIDPRVAFAVVTEVVERSPERRDGAIDPSCGGCLYAHIDVARQRAIKAAVLADAFARIGRHPLPAAIDVAASPERGYRLRARLHVRGSHVGFYREGTHELCDPSQTGQLLPAALLAATAAIRVIVGAGATARSIEISESVAADQRALHVELAASGQLSAGNLESVLNDDVTSASASWDRGPRMLVGQPTISDPLDTLTAGRASGELHRGAESFFQSNRFLVAELVETVIDSVLPEGAVLDLYAGVGLFALALAGAGRTDVTAVEGDRASGADLRFNASCCATPLTALVSPVEHYLARLRGLPPSVIVDPPRTGLSKAVLEALTTWGGSRVVYVSCDPATLARDARGLLDAGYRVGPVRAFDLFPNTPHIETVAVFDR